MFSILLIVLVSASAGFEDLEKFEYYDVPSYAGPTMDTTAYECQVFTIGTTGTNAVYNLNYTILNLTRHGTPGNVNVSFHLVNSSTIDGYTNPAPNHTRIITSKTKSINSLTEDKATNVQFNFTVEYSLNKSGLYSICVHAMSADGANYIKWSGNTAGTYVGGSTWYGTGPLGQRVNTDMQFEVYGNATRHYTSKYNSSALETSSQTFKIFNVSSGVSAPTSIKLNYNGTNYTGTAVNTGTENYTLSATIDIPEDVTGKWYFTWNNGSNQQTIFNRTQTVNTLVFDLCDIRGNSSAYLNISFMDEGTSTAINASIDTSTWIYWLGGGSQNKTLSFSNATNHSAYSFCLSPKGSTLNHNTIVQYSLTGYPQRRWAYSTALTDTMIHKTLYLLSSTDGMYVTYYIKDSTEISVKGATITARRKIDGSWTTISSGVTGDDGGVTFWLNPDYEHQIVVEKTGYASVTQTHTPTQATYTIYLGTTPIREMVNYNRGILYRISPTLSTLNNNTVYVFNFSINSSYWDLDSFGFVLTNGSDILASNSSTLAAGGFITITNDTRDYSNYTHFVMNYYWVIEGNYTNGTRSWMIGDTKDYGFSIKTFFTDLKRYTDEEMFGLNAFSRTLIVFFIIFTLVGIMTYMSGVYSPGAISLEVFILVALFDYGLGMIPNPSNAVPHFTSVFIGLITIGLLLWEMRK